MGRSRGSAGGIAQPVGLARYRVGFEAGWARRRAPMGWVLGLWGVALVLSLACGAPLIWHSAFGESIRIGAFVLLGIVTGLQYLGGVRVMRRLRLKDGVPMAIAAVAPAWIAIVTLLSLIVGGPLVCSIVWGAALSVGFGEVRGLVVGLLLGAVGTVGAGVGLVAEQIAPMAIPDGLVLFVAVLAWHIVHGPLVLVVACERAWALWRDTTRCLYCDYDLRGLAGSAEVCPECGQRMWAREAGPEAGAVASTA